MSHTGRRLLLTNADLAKLVCLRAFALASFQITSIAISWQVYLFTGDALSLGFIGMVQFLPVLVLAPLSGTVSDRMDRRHVSAAASIGGCVATFVLIWASSRSQITLAPLLALLAIIATGRVFGFPAQSAMTPSIVARADLGRAITISSTANKIAMIGGPALGGLLLTAGPQANYAVSAALLATSALLSLSIRPFEQPRGEKQPISFAEMVRGVPFIFSRPLLLGAMSLDLFATLLGGATALLPIYVRDILHAGPEILGLLRSAPAIGAVAMAVILVRYPIGRHAGRIMLGGAAIYGLATIIFGLSVSLPLSVAALMIVGATDFCSTIVRQTVVQLGTPDEMRGRVAAVSAACINASNNLGQFESGAVAALAGPVGSVVIGGVGTLLIAFIWARRFPMLAHIDLSHEALADIARSTDRKTVV